MEIGQSNQAGTMGEEAIGALVLSRPESSSWFWLVLIPLFLLGTFGGQFVNDWLTQSWGWRGKDADASVSIVVSLSLFALYWTFEKFRVAKVDLELRIERGNGTSGSSPKAIEFWNGLVFPKPEPLNMAHLFLGMTLGKGLAQLIPADLAGALVLCGIAVIVLLMFKGHRSGSHSTELLLKADLQQVTTPNQTLEWKNIYSVLVKHVRDLSGEFRAVQLTFEGINRVKLAQITIPKELCTVPAEKAMLELMTKSLNHS